MLTVLVVVLASLSDGARAGHLNETSRAWCTNMTTYPDGYSRAYEIELFQLVMHCMREAGRFGKLSRKDMVDPTHCGQVRIVSTNITQYRVMLWGKEVTRHCPYATPMFSPRKCRCVALPAFPQNFGGVFFLWLICSIMDWIMGKLFTCFRQ